MTMLQPWPNESPLFLPVTGPPPFNTLVVAQGLASGITFTPPEDGNLHFGTSTVGTNFVLPEFDPRQPIPPFQHSTTAWIFAIAVSAATNFTVAINDIAAAYFDYTGRWTVKLDAAALTEANFESQAVVSSWILITLPPPQGT